MPLANVKWKSIDAIAFWRDGVVLRISLAIGGNYRWSVSKNGCLAIEGYARSAARAKLEAERAAPIAYPKEPKP